MSTSIPKNMITARFGGTNLDVWAPQIRCAADLLGVGYLFNEDEVNFTDQAKQIEALKALAVITTNITPAINEVIHSLKKCGFNPKAAQASGQTPSGTQMSALAVYPLILAHTAVPASLAGKTTLPATLLSFVDVKNKLILAPDYVWNSLFNLYGKVGLAAINKEVSAILQIRIPANVSPQCSIDELIMHYNWCNTHKLGMLLQLALGLIITAKLPGRYNTIIQDVVKTNTAVPSKICKLAIAISEGAQSFKHSASRGGSQANLANVVKHKPASNPQWRSGNSGSSGTKPRFDAKKKGNGMRSDAPRNGNLRDKRNGKPPRGPNRSGKRPNGKRRGGHTHAATADNLGMHFATSAVHVDAAPPQVRPTAT
jgi:hypothetical protein